MKSEFAETRTCRAWLAIVRTLALTMGEMESHCRVLSRRLILAAGLRIFHSGARVEAERPVKRLQKIR